MAVLNLLYMMCVFLLLPESYRLSPRYADVALFDNSALLNCVVFSPLLMLMLLLLLNAFSTNETLTSKNLSFQNANMGVLCLMGTATFVLIGSFQGGELISLYHSPTYISLIFPLFGKLSTYVIVVVLFQIFGQVLRDFRVIFTLLIVLR